MSLRVLQNVPWYPPMSPKVSLGAPQCPPKCPLVPPNDPQSVPGPFNHDICPRATEFPRQTMNFVLGQDYSRLAIPSVFCTVYIND